MKQIHRDKTRHHNRRVKKNNLARRRTRKGGSEPFTIEEISSFIDQNTDHIDEINKTLNKTNAKLTQELAKTDTVKYRTLPKRRTAAASVIDMEDHDLINQQYSVMRLQYQIKQLEDNKSGLKQIHIEFEKDLTKAVAKKEEEEAQLAELEMLIEKENEIANETAKTLKNAASISERIGRNPSGGKRLSRKRKRKIHRTKKRELRKRRGGNCGCTRKKELKKRF